MRASPLPPGPKGHFLLGVLPEIRKDDLAFLESCVRQYGDIVYVRVVNHPAYILSHPRDIESVLITNSDNFIKSVFLRESRALFGRGLLTSEGNLWEQQRRLLQPTFQHEHVGTYGRTMVESAERMMAMWLDGEVRDVHRDMTSLTLEIVAKVLFGDDMASDAERACEAFRVFFSQFDNRFGLYLIPEWLPTPANLRYRKAIGRLDEIIRKVIRHRRAGNGHSSDMLSALLRARQEDGAGMTEGQLRDEMMTLFFTGHETTALALSWTWYLLAQHPKVEARVFEEVDRVLGGRAPTSADIPHLDLVEMVVKESLRLYPPAYGVVREAVKDCEIGGYPIPAGATVAMFQWVVHRDGRYFDQPEEFLPDRWANDFARRLPKCAYFPFGLGPRVCIGNAFAMTELVLLVSAIARKFQFRLVPGHRVAISPSLTLRPLHGIRVTLKKR